MHKTIVMLGALSLPASAWASQDPPPQERLQAVVRCLDIADSQARLACFDASAGDLREGLQSGALAVSRRARIVLPVVASITGINRSESGYWQVDLDNGQVWRTEESQATTRVPQAGTPIRIEAGVFGGYWLQLPNKNRYKVRLIP